MIFALKRVCVTGYQLLHLLGYNQSVASAVGFIALAGVAAAVRDGALLRVRPKAMTVAVILAGQFPALVGGGTGSEVMSRIAAPMVDGMLTAPLLSMLIIPAAYLLMRRKTPPHVQPEGKVK